MKINAPEIPDDENGNPFMTLGELIKSKISVGTLASAIEQYGIYTWDRFGRFGKACDADRERALDLLEAQHKWEADPDAERCDDPRSPLEQYNDLWDSPFDRFGWAAKVPPPFDNIRQSQLEDLPKQVVKLKRKAPDAFVTAFMRLLIHIAKCDPEINLDKMPGIKSDLHAVARKFDARLDHTYTTFDTYIGGLCKFKHGARSSKYYEKLFPDYFK